VGLVDVRVTQPTGADFDENLIRSWFGGGYFLHFPFGLGGGYNGGFHGFLLTDKSSV
jgi:hypothetical protein